MHMKLAALTAMAGSAVAFSPMMMSMDMDRRGPFSQNACIVFPFCLLRECQCAAIALMSFMRGRALRKQARALA